MRVAVAINLTKEERATLESYARGRSTPARLVLRAKIVLRSAKGMENKDIAKELGTLQKTVGLWRRRIGSATGDFRGPGSESATLGGRGEVLEGPDLPCGVGRNARIFALGTER